MPARVRRHGGHPHRPAQEHGQGCRRRLYQRYRLCRLSDQEGPALPGGLYDRGPPGEHVHQVRRHPGHPDPEGLPGHLLPVRRGRVRCPGPEDLRQRAQGLWRPRKRERAEADRTHPPVCRRAHQVRRQALSAQCAHWAPPPKGEASSKNWYIT